VEASQGFILPTQRRKQEIAHFNKGTPIPTENTTQNTTQQYSHKTTKKRREKKRTNGLPSHTTAQRSERLQTFSNTRT
jgi:hypothetical protein